MKKLLLIATLTYINEIVGTHSELTIKKHPDFVGEMPATLFSDLTEQDYELVVEKHKNGQISTITPTSVEMGYVYLFDNSDTYPKTFFSPAVSLTIPTDADDVQILFNRDYAIVEGYVDEVGVETIALVQDGVKFRNNINLPTNWHFGGYFVDKSELD